MSKHYMYFLLHVSVIGEQGYMNGSHGNSNIKESKGGGYLQLWPIKLCWCPDARLSWECTDHSGSVAILQGSVFWDSDQECQVLVVVCQMCFKPERRLYTKHLCFPFERGPGWWKVSSWIFSDKLRSNIHCSNQQLSWDSSETQLGIKYM